MAENPLDRLIAQQAQERAVLEAFGEVPAQPKDPDWKKLEKEADEVIKAAGPPDTCTMSGHRGHAINNGEPIWEVQFSVGGCCDAWRPLYACERHLQILLRGQDWVCERCGEKNYNLAKLGVELIQKIER